MTKSKTTVFGIEAITTLALVLLSAIALISAEASMPAAPKVEAGQISINPMQMTVNVSALPAQDGYAAF
jgi:hypothetical protein